jgi:FkbM family methyltransferase
VGQRGSVCANSARIEVVAMFEKKMATLRRDGITKILHRRYSVKKRQWQLDSWLAGKYVELVSRNIVKFGDLQFSLANPTIRTREKSSLFFGHYEEGELSLLPERMPRNLPVVEFGASIGVVSCVTNRLLQRPQDHVVVEANPNLIPTLERNRDLNGCKFTIISAALAYGEPRIGFSVSPYFLCGSIGGNVDQLTVPTITLQRILQEHGFERITLIVDVEGAEAQLLANEIDLIAQRVDTLLIEFHPTRLGKQGVEDLIDRITGRGFKKIADGGRGEVLFRSERSVA